jgi:hypothetical protein
MRELSFSLVSAALLAGASPVAAHGLSGPPISATEGCMVFPDQGRVCGNLNLHADYVVREGANRFVERADARHMAWWQAMIGQALTGAIKKHNARGIRMNNIAMIDVMPH